MGKLESPPVASACVGQQAEQCVVQMYMKFKLVHCDNNGRVDDSVGGNKLNRY